MRHLRDDSENQQPEEKDSFASLLQRHVLRNGGCTGQRGKQNQGWIQQRRRQNRADNSSRHKRQPGNGPRGIRQRHRCRSGEEIAAGKESGDGDHYSLEKNRGDGAEQTDHNGDQQNQPLRNPLKHLAGQVKAHDETNAADKQPEQPAAK